MAVISSTQLRLLRMEADRVTLGLGCRRRLEFKIEAVNALGGSAEE
jgi:hypothetical protein